jgi:Leucine-rich repeat (LRR) protein
MLSTYLQGQDKELLEFGELDVSLKGVKVINHLSLSAHFISHLYLDGNHLLSLTGIEQFHNLEVLHFDYNYVSLPSEVNKITNPFFMREISFIGNPI